MLVTALLVGSLIGSVGIGVDEHRLRLQSLYVLRPVVVAAEQVGELRNECPPVGVGVEVVERALGYALGGLGTHLHPGEDLRVPALPLEGGRDQHELSNHLGVADGRLQRDAAPQ